MLAGRNDAASLNVFVRDFGERFAEPDGLVHGAYGHRWRQAFIMDQLEFVIDKLQREPSSRQCVIQMWDCDHDLMTEVKDRPCNTHIYLRIHESRLDLTACCRSNDAIWGAHGANAVHFSVLQEYLAARLGLQIGILYQFSNNYHVYLSELKKYTSLDDNRYADDHVRPLLMFTEPSAIDRDLVRFMQCFEKRDYSAKFVNPWFEQVLIPMMMAHHQFKDKRHAHAIQFAGQIEAIDWRVACQEWLERRS
jgi:hypothetical protein